MADTEKIGKYIPCPKCKKKKSVSQDFSESGQHIQVSRDASTVGEIAERNTKNMGTYELEDKRKAYFDSKKKAKRTMLTENGIIKPGDPLPEDSKPWYGKMDKETKKQIETNPARAEKYIMEGK
jgi:hypothetical protein